MVLSLVPIIGLRHSSLDFIKQNLVHTACCVTLRPDATDRFVKIKDYSSQARTD